MRKFLITIALLLGAVTSGAIGYRAALWRLDNQQSEREKQSRKEIAMVGSMLADIADHRKKGEVEIANWKLEAAHGSLEGYIRDGGPDPTIFVPEIVIIREIPQEEP